MGVGRGARGQARSQLLHHDYAAERFKLLHYYHGRRQRVAEGGSCPLLARDILILTIKTCKIVSNAGVFPLLESDDVALTCFTPSWKVFCRRP